MSGLKTLNALLISPEMNFKILISPAKNLKKHKLGDVQNVSEPSFLKEAKKIHRSLVKLKQRELADMMSISPQLAEEVFQMNRQWKKDFYYRAVDLFDGEVYRGLNAATLPKACQSILSDRLRILSGLYGLLSPNNLVAPYRLEMKTQLPVGEFQNLYQFWDKKVARRLKKETEYLVNLASEEYSKVVLPYWNKTKVIHPVFMEENGGNPKVVMMYAKNARGKMARFIIENNITQLTDIQAFDLDSYRFVADLSDGNRWVFLR